ncbi:MAG: ribokinase [Verrucomicrobiales bacterium]|nr:ribokinase [Verrucomicrobiales bacterium]
MSNSTQKSVSVLGSLNIDYFTKVETLPVPGETVASLSLELFQGGKGANQAISAARQGANVTLIGTVGDDAEGESYRRALEAEKIDLSCLQTGSARTGCAFITVDEQGENMIVVSSGANAELTDAAIQEKKARLSSADAVLANFEIPIPALIGAARIANAASVPLVINPSPYDPVFPWQEIQTDYLIVNEGEATEVMEFDPLQEDESLVRQRLTELRVEHLIITRGSDETIVYRRSGEAVAVETLPVLPVDTVGAGDAFAGCFTCRIAEGDSLENAIRAANCAGALTTLGPGAQNPIPDREKVTQHLEHLST